MFTNLILISLIIVWVALVVFGLAKNWHKAKKQGLPASCAGCSAQAKGKCSRQCSGINVDTLIEKAKINLAEGNK